MLFRSVVVAEDGLADGIRVALDDREALVAAGLERARAFSWRAAAERTIAVYQEALSLDPPLCAGVASRPAHKDAPRPGGTRFFSVGRFHPDGALRAGKGSCRLPACLIPSPRVLVTRTSASRSRTTVEPG